MMRAIPFNNIPYVGMLFGLFILFYSCKQLEFIQPNIDEQLSAIVPPDMGTLSSGETMEIGVYLAPPFSYTTLTNYQWIKEANIDFIQDISGQHTLASKLSMLDMAHQAGLKMIVADNRIDGTDLQITDMMNDYHLHPAVKGYFIKDEPTPSQLADAATRYNKVLAYDSSKIPHVNLFPSYATGALGNIDYENNYVKQWINLVGAANLKYISMDNYPFLWNGTFRATEYYHDLDVIRRLGNKYNIKTSSYLQSVGVQGVFRRPSTDELRFSAYSNLAYGIKIPVWFTYWTPQHETEVFTDAIIDPKGAKTNLYDPFKILNAELKMTGNHLMDLKAVAVYHSGSNIPTGATGVPINFLIKPVNTSLDLIISHFLNPVTAQEYIMIVNKSLTTAVNAAFLTNNTVSNVQWVSKTNGSVNATDFNPSTSQFSSLLLPGEGRLFPLTVHVPSRTVTTLSGSGQVGHLDGGATAARFNFATNTGMGVDHIGNVYIADINNHCIRKIDVNGNVSTLAGNPGVIGNTDGTGSTALFNHPTDLVVDSQGNVYVADTWNWAVRKITPAGVVTTVLGWVIPFPQGITIDEILGKIYLVSALPSASNGKLYELTVGGALTTRTLDRFIVSGGITLDKKGDLIIVDNGSSVVFRVNRSSWETEIIAGQSGSHGYTDGIGTQARFYHPWGVSVDQDNNIYVAGAGNKFDDPGVYAQGSNIRKIDVNSDKVSTVLGGASAGYVNGTTTVAQVNLPTDIAIYQQKIYVLDRNNTRIRLVN
ncbi:NHL repeat-containing protein [Sphingobacterium yanglingense]|uniref:NHL repeat-containing protein n=1 Tax=Sphingobacterium yanglingense TaxID=1437280 RepID=A0A4R6WTP9_9SPHI|nr:hypothetical protein [Sphingobacterium yanglingense]TDQ80166.1 NHL repeat-containing protein [Sphingobacterium yanglingense]